MHDRNRADFRTAEMLSGRTDPEKTATVTKNIEIINMGGNLYGLSLFYLPEQGKNTFRKK